MTEALAAFDAYVAREKGPPSRSACRALSDRLRELEPAYTDALSRERANLNVIGALKAELERSQTQSVRQAERLEESRALNGRQAAALGLHADKRRELQRRVDELEADAAKVDQILADSTAPSPCITALQLTLLAGLSFAAGFTFHVSWFPWLYLNG